MRAKTTTGSRFVVGIDLVFIMKKELS